MKFYFLLFAVSFALGCGSKVSFKSVQTSHKTNESEVSVEGNVVSESFEQKGRYVFEKVDIVVVSDSSASMNDSTYRKISEKLDNLFSDRLNNVDWRIAVVDTYLERNGGRFTAFSSNQLFLTKDVPGHKEQFFGSMKGTSCIFCMAQFEQSFKTFSESLKREENQSFFRQEADLHVLFITDNDDTAFFYGVEKFLSEVRANLTNRSVKFHGIIIPKRDTQCLRERRGMPIGNSMDRQNTGKANYARKIQKVIEETGGEVHSICAGNYDNIFEEIAQKEGKNEGIRLEFPLSYLPMKGSMKVTLSPKDERANWFVEGKNLIFSEPPRLGTKITVEYEIDEGQKSAPERKEEAIENLIPEDILS